MSFKSFENSEKLVDLYQNKAFLQKRLEYAEYLHSGKEVDRVFVAKKRVKC